MILPIYIYGQPVLRKVAEDITPDYPNLSEIIANMYETLDAAEGIGLAAPQIGMAIRLVVIDLDVLKEDLPEYASFRHVFINPHIVEVDNDSEKVSLESVARHTRIHVTYLDENMAEHDEWVEGYLARVMQHEFDHLEGTMFVDRLTPLRKQLIRSKLKQLTQGKYRCSYRTKPVRR